jgi:hypothetical protein
VRHYSSFRVSAIQELFTQAVADLHRHKLRLQRSLQQQQQQQGVAATAANIANIAAAELHVVQVVLGLVTVLMTAGHTEQAVGRVQVRGSVLSWVLCSVYMRCR